MSFGIMLITIQRALGGQH